MLKLLAYLAKLPENGIADVLGGLQGLPELVNEQPIVNPTALEPLNLQLVVGGFELFLLGFLLEEAELLLPRAELALLLPLFLLLMAHLFLRSFELALNLVEPVSSHFQVLFCIYQSLFSF